MTVVHPDASAAGSHRTPGGARLAPVPRKVRDLTLLDVDGGRVLVVACDSLGGIGPKEADSSPAAAAETAHFAARVPLLEVLSAGAEPVMVVNTLAVEADPTGAEMIAAVRELAAAAGLTAPDAVTGSTEENVPTRATGVGVTVLALAGRGDLRPGTSLPGDRVVCLGEPVSAPARRPYVGDPRLVALEELRAAVAVPGVHDALPVGSRGIRYELGELAATAGLRAQEEPGCALDLDGSGGPASCVLVSCAPDALGRLTALRAGLPVTVVARLT
jgi:hypothetical protein